MVYKAFIKNIFLTEKYFRFIKIKNNFEKLCEIFSLYVGTGIFLI